MAPSFTQWYSNPYQPGVDVPEPFFRDQLDMRRAMYHRTPDAEYPDGYLGTITSRRDDRLLNATKARLNEKQYQRGVHKGEKIDQSDYFWPDVGELDPMGGIRRQATTGLRHAPAGQPAQVLVAEGKMQGAAMGVLSTNPKRAQQLAHLQPRWK